jgi:hypothetical protein
VTLHPAWPVDEWTRRHDAFAGVNDSAPWVVQQNRPCTLPARKAAIQPHLGALWTVLMGTCDVSSSYKPEVGVVAALISQVLTWGHAVQGVRWSNCLWT